MPLSELTLLQIVIVVIIVNNLQVITLRRYRPHSTLLHLSQIPTSSHILPAIQQLVFLQLTNIRACSNLFYIGFVVDVAVVKLVGMLWGLLDGEEMGTLVVLLLGGWLWGVSG